jgi:hypothetical protein
MAIITGSRGQLLRVLSFTSSGTWTKGNDVGMVQVKVIGGGGGGSGFSGNGGTGGSSSFGSHLSASGGSGGTSSTGGNGGVGSSGDINLSGEKAPNTAGIGHTSGGDSFLSRYGKGGGAYSDPGNPDVPADFRSGGGGGGYSERVLIESSLGSTESITVGAAGSAGAPGGLIGNAGLVIVYEYSK